MGRWTVWQQIWSRIWRPTQRHETLVTLPSDFLAQASAVQHRGNLHQRLANGLDRVFVCVLNDLNHLLGWSQAIWGRFYVEARDLQWGMHAFARLCHAGLYWRKPSPFDIAKLLWLRISGRHGYQLARPRLLPLNEQCPWNQKQSEGKVFQASNYSAGRAIQSLTRSKKTTYWDWIEELKVYWTKTTWAWGNQGGSWA